MSERPRTKQGECRHCQYYRVSCSLDIDDEGTCVVNCGHQDVTGTEFSGRLLDGEDCPHWWPNERHYSRIPNSHWQHTCPKVDPNYLVVWERHDKRWLLYDCPKEMEVDYCPWCGIELQPMPEVEERAS